MSSLEAVRPFAAKNGRRPRRSLIASRFLKNRIGLIGVTIIVGFATVAMLAPLVSPFAPDEQNLDYVLSPPSRTHLFGTDNLGRDIISRVIFGARLSIVIGIAASSVGLLLGGAIGVFSGFLGGRTDTVLMRVTDVLMAFPGILLALLIVGILGPGLYNVMLAVGISWTPTSARVFRAAVLQTRTEEYIEAAKAIGATDRRILSRHILPNSLGPVLVQASLMVATSILASASLSFLGLGPKPPTPEWGLMLTEARNYLYVAPHMMFFPGGAILLVAIGFNLAGNALRDALDIRFAIQR
jgi:peptide/nickel transport system permease protein